MPNKEFPKYVSETIDHLFERVRDGAIDRMEFGQRVIALGGEFVDESQRRAVEDYEQGMMLQTAANLPSC